jgi:hypothetical protein
MGDTDVIAADVAAKQLAAMEREFETPIVDKGARDFLIQAILRGRVDFDADAATVTYRLRMPVELENGATLSELAFREPTGAEQERINRGFSMKRDGDNNTILDIGDTHAQLLRQISVICGKPAGIVGRIKRRDWNVLQAISGFFQ